jgi:hypothetical protein
MKKVVFALVVAGLILGFSTSGKAELLDRGNGMYYDTCPDRVRVPLEPSIRMIIIIRYYPFFIGRRATGD